MRKAYILILSLLAIGAITSCGKDKDVEEAAPAVDRTIEEADPRYSSVNPASTGSESPAEETDEKPPRFSEDEIAEIVRNSGNDRNGDGHLTADDFDVVDEAGMDIEPKSIVKEDFVYERKDTESDDYMSNYLSITGISGTGKFVSVHKLDVITGNRTIETENGNARIIGNPYIIGVSDKEDFTTEYGDFHSIPLNASISYDSHLFDEAGIDMSEETGLKVYYLSPGDSTYREIQGELDLTEQKMEFIPGKPGSYVLALPGNNIDIENTEDTVSEDGILTEE